MGWRGVCVIAWKVDGDTGIFFFFCLGAQGKVRSVICASVSDPAEEVSEVEHERVRRNSETSEWCSRDMVLLQSSVIRWLV